MNRRTLIRSAVAGSLGSVGASLITAPQATAASTRPQVAVTFDDPTLTIGLGYTPADANRNILNTLAKRQLQTALFVCGQRVDSAQGRALVGEWDAAGHLIANHSYSHLYYHGTTYDEYAADFLRNVPVIERYSNYAPRFRYPFLKAGDTAEKRDRFRELLREHGYESGDVTIDASDWYVAQRLSQRLMREPAASTAPYRDYYVRHLLDRATFYRQLSLDVLGHEIRHTLLLHYNLTSTLFLADLIAAFEQAGWQWIDAQTAFEDPVFQKQPETLPAGESLVYALAKETGRFDDRLRYPAEDGRYEQARMDRLEL